VSERSEFISPDDQVDLTNCDREPIHIPGRVQSFGFLLAMDEDEIIRRCSANVAEFLGKAPEDVLDAPARDILGQAGLHAVRGQLQMLGGQEGVERLFGMTVPGVDAAFDLAVHRSGPLSIVEGQPSAKEGTDAAAAVSRVTARLGGTPDVQALADGAARHLRALTRFDRVMVYRFAEDGSGEVIAEAARADLPSYLGLHYPASDIPQQARKLYMRNLLRIIPDVAATPSPILPDASFDGAPIDMSHSVLRAVSPIHIEYLQNIGVDASMSVSILRGGRLWGLFACHHMSPHAVPFDIRTAAELFGQIFSFMLDSRIQTETSRHETQARRIHAGMMRSLATGADPLENITDALDAMRELLDASGAAVRLSGKTVKRGDAPGGDALHRLAQRFQGTGPDRIFATDHVGEFFENAGDMLPKVAGLLVVPLSRTSDDCLMFFRDEIVKEVNWAGDPAKPAIGGPDGARLSPRKSFDLWKETVRGRSKPWSEQDQMIAESLRVSLLEVVLQLTDMTARNRKEAQERQELLIAELNHRVRNILSLIRGLIAQSKSGAKTVDELVQVIGERIQSLARAHDQLTESGWAPRPLRDLIRSEADAYFGEKAHRIHMKGPSVLVTAEAFATLALVIHELVTNSAKYGALADSAGEISVEWSIRENGALELHWGERGGPPVKPPSRKGFGSTIVDRVIPHDLKGEAEIEYPLSGVRARFVIPAIHIAEVGEEIVDEGGRKIDTDAGDADELKLGRTLLVEDNLIIAMDAEELLLKCGADSVDTAGSVAEALRIIEQQAPDIAVLDVNLGSESSLKVAEKLTELGVPFLFATGYGDRADLGGMEDIPVVTKPYSADTMRPQLAQLLAAKT